MSARRVQASSSIDPSDLSLILRNVQVNANLFEIRRLPEQLLFYQYQGTICTRSNSRRPEDPHARIVHQWVRVLLIIPQLAAVLIRSDTAEITRPNSSKTVVRKHEIISRLQIENADTFSPRALYDGQSSL